MNRKIMIAFLFAAGILVAPAYYSYVVDAFAQSPAAPVAAQAAGPVAVGEAMAQKDKQDHVAIIAVAPQTQPGVIDTGTIAGDALTWVITTFGVNRSLAKLFSMKGSIEPLREKRMSGDSAFCFRVGCLQGKKLCPLGAMSIWPVSTKS